ncbi:hypothetical protein M378DRAFT_18466 [Amanita muscaria Koide BX008]|uniref:Uncharacterized protein n=1 Tax=Amanita muscaria (strain Koide BX008) TaxID=946122 RepID=A0A0C2SLR3_AMAMK|nr:hypothetical protein M378DRAFT_18466 [Amanita muscaria Koide BX008]
MAEQPPIAAPSTQEQNEMSTYGRGLWISYKVDIRTRLRSLLHSVARFLRIMSPSSHDPLEEFKILKRRKTGFASVEGFYTSLLNLYKSAATCRIDHNRWKVTKISTFKSTHGVQHESLLADVVCGEVTVYLRFERKLHKSRVGKLFSNRSKATPKAQTSDESDPSSDNATSPHDPTEPFVTRSLSKYASDEMTYSTILKRVTSGDDECVDVVQFAEGKGLTLPQIAVLAYCVNSMGPDYSLVEENCYWFAFVMGETAKLIETDFTLEKTSRRKRGSWGSLLTTAKPTDELIEKAKFLYNKKWDAFNKDIYDSINNENSEIYQEERRKREEAERLAAEREKQGKEERRKREEAERLAAEREKQGKEERRKREEAERLAAEKEEENKALRAQVAAFLAANGANSSSS